MAVCPPVNWSRRPDSVFRAALFLSALSHALLMGWLKFPEHPLRMEIGGGYAPLTVRLAPSSKQAAAEQPALFSSDLRLNLLEPSPIPNPELPLVEIVESNREVPAETPPTEVVEQAVAPATEQPAPPPAFVDRREPVLRPGMATVFLRISEDGKVEQMIWDQLPVVTQEELLQMERELREKNYPATGSAYTVAETVIVPRARELNIVAP